MFNMLVFPRYGFTSQAHSFKQKKVIKEEGSLTQGGVYTWYDGARKMRVWLALDEVALFREPSIKLDARDLEVTIQALYPEAKVIKSNDFVTYIKLPQQISEIKLEEKLSVIRIQRGFKGGSPVFYPTAQKNVSDRMALTGEIIIHFHADWDREKLLTWAKSYGLSLLKKFPFAPNAYLFANGAAMESLHLANEIYLSGEVLYAYPNWLKTMSKRSTRATPDDTMFGDQWHLENTGQGGGTAGEDVNIETVWDTYKASTNEVIAIVDDGLESAHEDLSPNVLAGLSHDYVDGDDDPSPGIGDDHGTACAGVAAARGFNTQGVVGAAPWAALVGHRLLGAGTDVNEADALIRNNQLLDIYSNSWGPYDDGWRLDGPGNLTEAALANGVTNGRGGLGNIYVWAGGNGYDDDNSNYDGYANSRYTIAVAASTNYGNRASYSEKGANILVNAPSNGGSLGITTTDRTGALGYDPGNYTNTFGGTSSAAPLVSGIIALILEANPDLSWRDVQQILVNTAEKNDPSDSDWTTNAAGFNINHKYGFGRIDAQAAVTAAISWTNIGPEVSVVGLSSPNLSIPDNDSIGVSDTITIADDINIESVEVYFSAADHTYWGDLEIELTSPAGTTSILAEQHSSGSSYTYDNWRFGSVRHLGESSQGTWTLTVKDLYQQDTGTFQSWTLKIYGTVAGYSIITHILTPPDETTAAQGESLGPFLVEETNNTDSNVEFYVQGYLVKPDDTTVWFRQLLTGLTAGEFRSHGHVLTVPLWSEIGDFTWGVVLTDLYGNQIDEDTFDFTVVSGSPSGQSPENSQRLRRLMNAPGTQVIEKDGWKMVILPEGKQPVR